MIIRKSTMADLPEMEKLYEEARAFMAAHGNPNQWTDGYPRHELLVDDIEKGNSYICEKSGTLAATFCFFAGNEPDYDGIFEGSWQDERPYGVVHRIASREKGAGTFCLDYCYNKTGNIRIDTSADNSVMQACLKKNGYVYCGKIILSFNGEERIGFQKK